MNKLKKVKTACRNLVNVIFAVMEIDKLFRAAVRLEYYRGVLADIEEVMDSEHPLDALKRKRRRYRQYVSLYEKKFEDAKRMLK